MRAAAGSDPTRLPARVPLPRRAVLPGREVPLLLQPQPRASKALEGEFSFGATLQPPSQPRGQPGAGGPLGRATVPWETALPPATQGEESPDTLTSPLIQTVFRKRRRFTALIISPGSGYCLISSCCHLNTMSYAERTGQSRPVPRHSPVHTRGSCLPQHSPTAPARGRARWMPTMLMLS